MSSRCGLATLFALAGFSALWPVPGSADAIVRSEAMFAATIAEIYVEQDAVRLELEVGIEDLAGGFRALLPDALYQRLGLGDEPLSERLPAFLEEQFVLVADGERLAGAMTAIGPATRVRRDAITGEPLPDEGEPETIVNASFRWPLASAPEQLVIRLALPDVASVGFVAYHEGIAVNDFRYLTAEQVLNLDWDDPWYSAFERRALRRQYYAPMAGFIYVEPYEVRKEIIVRPRDVQRYVDLGLEGRDTIPVEMQPAIREAVIEFLSAHQPVIIDGEPAEAAAVRADFLERSLRTSRVIDPPEELDLDAAIMGVKFIYPHPDFPDNVTMTWDLFDERISTVPVSAVDPTGPFPQFLEPDYNRLEWQNFIRVPVMPELADVTRPPGRLSIALYWGRWLLVALALLLVVRVVRAPAGQRTRAAGMAIAGLALAAAGWWQGGQARLDEAATRDVVAGLLTNVYRAFDFRSESDVYDVLARSVDGDLLRQAYLEMRRGLVLASQGGASARVKTVELGELEATPGEGQSIKARAAWELAAAVGHWGHIHERRNAYQADLTIEPVGGAWKLTDVEILDEVRVQ